MACAYPVRTLRPLPELDFHDSQSVRLPVAIPALEAWNLMTGRPGPLMRLAFRTRDAIASRFGVRRIHGFSETGRSGVQAGDRLSFFLVEEASADLLVLTDRDRHLDVMICISTGDRQVTVTASVITHNAFGRLYMVPVGLAHRLIVRRDLRQLKRHLDAAAPDPAAG